MCSYIIFEPSSSILHSYTIFILILSALHPNIQLHCLSYLLCIQLILDLGLLHQTRGAINSCPLWIWCYSFLVGYTMFICIFIFPSWQASHNFTPILTKVLSSPFYIQVATLHLYFIQCYLEGSAFSLVSSTSMHTHPSTIHKYICHSWRFLPISIWNKLHELFFHPYVIHSLSPPPKLHYNQQSQVTFVTHMDHKIQIAHLLISNMYIQVFWNKWWKWHMYVFPSKIGILHAGMTGRHHQSKALWASPHHYYWGKRGKVENWSLEVCDWSSQINTHKTNLSFWC